MDVLVEVDGVNQKWSITESGRIKFGDLSSRKCVTAYDGRVFIYDCIENDRNQEFVFLPGGEIRPKSALNTKCLDVESVLDSYYLAGYGLPYNGAGVQLFDCLAGQLSQKWSFHSAVKHFVTDLCLDRVGNSSRDGIGLRIWNCKGNLAQQWDYYFSRP